MYLRARSGTPRVLSFAGPEEEFLTWLFSLFRLVDILRPVPAGGQDQFLRVRRIARRAVHMMSAASSVESWPISPSTLSVAAEERPAVQLSWRQGSVAWSLQQQTHRI